MYGATEWLLVFSPSCEFECVKLLITALNPPDSYLTVVRHDMR